MENKNIIVTISLIAVILQVRFVEGVNLYIIVPSNIKKHYDTNKKYCNSSVIQEEKIATRKVKR